MKKTIFALTATLALAGLANAEVNHTGPANFDRGDQAMTVESAQQCWQEQMEKLFTDFEPEYKGTPLWVIKADMPPSMNCELSEPRN